MSIAHGLHAMRANSIHNIYHIKTYVTKQNVSSRRASNERPYNTNCKNNYKYLLGQNMFYKIQTVCTNRERRLAVNKRPHEIREAFYHDISMRINEDFSFYRLYHGIYATICSRRTPAKACLLKLYFLLQFSKALSNRQYRRFSFRVNQDIFCHSMTPCP